MVLGVLFFLIHYADALCTTQYNYSRVDFRVYLGKVAFVQDFSAPDGPENAAAACLNTNTSCGNQGTCKNCLANSPFSTCQNNTQCACLHCGGLFPLCPSQPCLFECVNNTCVAPQACLANAESCGVNGNCLNCSAASAASAAACSLVTNNCTCLSSPLSCGAFPSCSNCTFPSTCNNNVCVAPAQCFQTNVSCGVAGFCQDCAANNGYCTANATCACLFGCNATAFPACPAQDCLAPNACVNGTCLGPEPPCFNNATSCGMPGACFACLSTERCIDNVCKAECGNNATSCGNGPLSCAVCVNSNCVNQTCVCFGNATSCAPAGGGGSGGGGCSSCPSLYSCSNQTCLPPPPCFGNQTSCGSPGMCLTCPLNSACVNGACACFGNATSCGNAANSCGVCGAPSTCQSNTCIAPPPPCASSSTSCGQAGACAACGACSICRNNVCLTCAEANVGGGSVACTNGQCECAFEGFAAASCGVFPFCKRCLTGQTCSDVNGSGECVSTIAGGGGGGAGGCRSIDFAQRIGPGGCFHKDSHLSYNGLKFDVLNVPTLVPCVLHDKFMTRGWTIETEQGSVLRLTGNHQVFLKNGSAVRADMLSKGMAVLGSVEERVSNVTQDEENSWFYNVECDGGVVVNGIKCK